MKTTEIKPFKSHKEAELFLEEHIKSLKQFSITSEPDEQSIVRLTYLYRTLVDSGHYKTRYLQLVKETSETIDNLRGICSHNDIALGCFKDVLEIIQCDGEAQDDFVWMLIIREKCNRFLKTYGSL